MRRSMILFLGLVLISSLSLPLGAAELAGVTLSDTTDLGGTALHLNGMGLRKKIGFKVYAAGLYLPEKSGDADAILEGDGARKLVMSFLRKVSKDQLCGGWDEGLENNTPDASAEVKEQFKALCGHMADVGKGDEIIFAYQPGSGTEVWVQGASKGTIEGKPFADALFACWLGPEPPSDDFKEGILGQ